MAEKSMVDALTKYGERSVYGMERMVDALRKQIRSAPPELDAAAGFVADLMPGRGFLESADIARESGQLWRDGRYGRSIGRMSDAMIPAMTELTWMMVPGAGFIPRIMK